MRWLVALATLLALSIPTVALAVNLTDLLRNKFVAFSTLHRDTGGYIVFLQEKSFIYACAVFESQSTCVSCCTGRDEPR